MAAIKGACIIRLALPSSTKWSKYVACDSISTLEYCNNSSIDTDYHVDFSFVTSLDAFLMNSSCPQYKGKLKCKNAIDTVKCCPL